MPNIQYKSPEMLQAQAAAFAAEYSGYGDGQQHAQLVGHKMTALEVLPVSQRDNALIIDSRDKEYIEFLRKRDGSGYETIQDRQELLENYEPFSPKIDGLLEDVAGLEPYDWQERSDFLGYGSNCVAFEIEHEGENYAVRIPRPDRNFSMDRDYVKASLKAKGRAHIEQIVAASYEKGVTIAQKMPGRRIDRLNIEDLESITDQDIEDLIDTFKFADEMNLRVDPKVSNIFYDRKEGLGLIDLIDVEHRPELAMAMNQDSVTFAGFGALVFNQVVLHAENREEFEDYADLARLYDVAAELIERYGDIYLESYADSPDLAKIETALSKVEGEVVRYKRKAVKARELSAEVR